MAHDVEKYKVAKIFRRRNYVMAVAFIVFFAESNNNVFFVFQYTVNHFEVCRDYSNNITTSTQISILEMRSYNEK